jgi:hypothetical protein
MALLKLGKGHTPTGDSGRSCEKMIPKAECNSHEGAPRPWQSRVGGSGLRALRRKHVPRARVLVTTRYRMRPRTESRAALFPISIPAGWAPENCCFMGRDPYSAAVTREIQLDTTGVHSIPPGRTIKRPAGIRLSRLCGVYLAPTINLPFDVVRRAFFLGVAGPNRG